MLVTEFRIPLPFTLDEYQIGQLWSTMEMSKEETGGGDGVEIVVNEPFKDKAFVDGLYTSGQYTHKIFHIWSRLPGILRHIFSTTSCDIHEEAWNAYPYCNTVLTNPGFMKEKFSVTIESLHVPGPDVAENILHLPKERLDLRRIVYVDISNDPFVHRHSTNDPRTFKSVKTKRGPLTDNWMEGFTPLMMAYKVVTVEFKFFGLQGRVEQMVINAHHKVISKFHRKVFCWTDNWYGLTMKDIRRLEEQAGERLAYQLTRGSIRGSTAAV